MIPDYVNAWLRKHRPMIVVPKLVCMDGLKLSVQASSGHYCSPRTSNEARYDKVEVGFPSEKVDALMPYVEDPNGLPTQTVYAYVPVDILNQVIHDRGGLHTSLNVALGRVES